METPFDYEVPDYPPITRTNFKCPRCGSMFIDWNPEARRMKCLIVGCNWVGKFGDYPKGYRYISGSWEEAT